MLKLKTGSNTGSDTRQIRDPTQLGQNRWPGDPWPGDPVPSLVAHIYGFGWFSYKTPVQNCSDDNVVYTAVTDERLWVAQDQWRHHSCNGGDVIRIRRLCCRRHCRLCGLLCRVHDRTLLGSSIRAAVTVPCSQPQILRANIFRWHGCDDAITLAVNSKAFPLLVALATLRGVQTADLIRSSMNKLNISCDVHGGRRLLIADYNFAS